MIPLTNKHTKKIPIPEWRPPLMTSASLVVARERNYEMICVFTLKYEPSYLAVTFELFYCHIVRNFNVFIYYQCTCQ